jgi:hypothetical protein
MVRASVRWVPARSTPTPPVGEATKTQRPSGVTAIPNGLPPTPAIEIRLRPSAGADADAIVQRVMPAGATARTGAWAGTAEAGAPAGMACDPVQPLAPSVVSAASTHARATRPRPTGSY